MKRASLILASALLVGTAQAGSAKLVKGATLYPPEPVYRSEPIRQFDMPTIAITVKVTGQEIDRATTWTEGRRAYWQRVANRERITLTVYRGDALLEMIRPK